MGIVVRFLKNAPEARQAKLRDAEFVISYTNIPV